ncbi:hypothetical protein AAW14_00735 [Streptomyces hygroscopicus]|nr:hypothetical protein [Streptomyces hygroscopicus]
MSLRTTRGRRPQATSPDQALCGATLAPGHRITIFTVILLVVIVLGCSGHSVSDALGLVMAAGAAAAQIGCWLSGQRLAAGSSGGM